jgi:hypothetical protein
MAPRQLKIPEKLKSNGKKTSHSAGARKWSASSSKSIGKPKGSYPTAEIAFAAAFAIKNGFPLLHVTVYDNVEHTRTTIAASATP